MTEFGTRLRKARVSRGLSQASLGAQLDKAESTVRMWELGKSKPDIPALKKLSYVLGVSLDDLLGIEPRDYLSVSDSPTVHQSTEECTDCVSNPDECLELKLHMAFDNLLEAERQVIRAAIAFYRKHPERGKPLRHSVHAWTIRNVVTDLSYGLNLADEVLAEESEA